MMVDTQNTQISLDDLFVEKCPELVNDAGQIQIFSEEVNTENLKEEKQNGPQKK